MASTARLQHAISEMSPIFQQGSFSRPDEGDDALFYATDRFVSHLDTKALETVERLIQGLVVEKYPVILDLMAGWDSHISSTLAPARVVGLGLNPNELSKNRSLTETVLHDINKDPVLPFPDNTFDVVLNTVSVDYLTRPVPVFQEVARVLKPGGLFLVIFSNRLFPEKAVKVWQESSEEERVILVQEFFKESGAFEEALKFVSKGKPRPAGDRYEGVTPFSDPIYAIYAEKKGGNPQREKRPAVTMDFGERLSPEELEQRERQVGQTLCCPHCGEKMLKWAVPDNPFCQTWDNDFMYICFNDVCPYYVRGWDVMYRSTNQTMSYRCMYHPEKDRCFPIPVPYPKALREGIME